jgi:acetylornithine deacetylase/succinyl-diaminopimelate desuccinylase-like protein
VIEHEPAICTKEDNDILVSLTGSITRVWEVIPRLYWANGTSDARHFAVIWASGIEFGSVWWGIGEDEEWVSISWLESYYNILIDFLRKQNCLQEL